jgi:D-alanyl-D-alanine carboxypeptidase/D-alanyl-D-alanine-endopeptidase (penicillin-binding protein 4)
MPTGCCSRRPRLNNYQPPDGASSAGSDVDAIAVLLANYRGRD